MALRIIIILLFVTFAHSAKAETVFQTNAPLGNYLIDFPTSGSGVSRTPNSVFAYSIPYGITFDRVQMSVPTSQGIISKNESFIVLTLNQYPWNCMLADCYDNATTSKVFSVSSETKPDTGTYQWQFTSSTTVTVDGSVLLIIFDSGSPYTDFSYNGAFQEDAAAMNNLLYTKSLTVPTIKLCDGACDNNTFSPVPAVTESPWVRITSPVNGSSVNGSITFSVEANTGTTTADNVQLRFSSNYQSITPYDYTITSTGLSRFTYTVNIPDIEDTFQVIADLRSGTSSIVTSPDYRYFVTTENNEGNITSEQIASCDDESGLSWAICKVFTLLFVPSDASINKFFTLQSDLDDRFPVVYAFQFYDSINGLYTGASTASSTISYDFAGLGDLTLLSVDQLEAVPFQGWLRSIIGYLMWIMFAVLVYTRTLKVFNTNPQ